MAAEPESITRKQVIRACCISTTAAFRGGFFMEK
jgi:hypothetical protein